MCGNNHWIIMPNLTRSIHIDSWSGGPKSYLWQPVITSPVIQQTKMKTTSPQTTFKPQVFYLGWIQRQPVIRQLPSVCHTDKAHKAETAVCGSSIFICWKTGEAITGCHKKDFDPPGQESICIDLVWFGVIIQ